MSDTYLRIIPDDPKFVPSTACERTAVEVLRAVVPGCQVRVKRTDEVEFIDAGENFERVLCPHCGADLTEFWLSVMDRAASTGFSNLTFNTPCCRRSADLNQLAYEWPAAFAR